MLIRSAAVLAVVLVAGACARQPEPEPVTIMPSIDKAGNPSCPEGTVLGEREATGEQVCVEQPAT
jgi:hypothetical protein